MVEPQGRSSPRKLLHGRSRSGVSGASSISSPPTTPRKRSSAKKASGGTKNVEAHVVSPALSYEDQQSLNRSQSSLGKKKRQKSKKRMNLWKKKKNATTFDGDDLKQLLDVVTTRMHATEGLTGQTLQEDQLLNIVRDVLESRQENDINSALSFSDHTSKNDDKTNSGDDDGDGEVAPDTSLHQLIVILMGLLLQQRNVGEATPGGVPGTLDGVPGVVVAETDDLQKSNDSCSLITAPETKDTNSLVSMATEEQTQPPNEETDVETGVEYTFDELKTMLSIIKAAHHEIEDDESSVWSNASTLEFLDNSFSDEASTFENVFEKFINMIPVPTLAGIVDQDDGTLDLLEEEYSSDDETLDRSIGIETTSVREKNAETSQDVEVETQDDAPSSSLFFGNIWGRSNECADDARVTEDNAENGGLIEAVASTTPSPLIKVPDEPEDAETEIPPPSFFSGMFEAKTADSPRLNSEGSNPICFAPEATNDENEKPHAEPALAKETSIFSSISAMFTNPFVDNVGAEDGQTSEILEDQQINVDQTSLPSGDHHHQGGEASVACEETQCEENLGSTQIVDEETENQHSAVNSTSDYHPNAFDSSDDESSTPFDEDDGDDEDDDGEKTYNTCDDDLYLDQELGSDDELNSKEDALPVPASTPQEEQFAEGGKDNQIETTEIGYPMDSPDFIFDHICQPDIYRTDFPHNTQTTISSTSPGRQLKSMDESQIAPQSRKLELPRRSHALDDAAEEGAWDRVEHTIDELPQKKNESEKENTDAKTVADDANTYKGSRSMPKRPKYVFRMQFTPKGEENNMKQKRSRASRKESDCQRQDSSGLAPGHAANSSSVSHDVNETSSRGSRHKMRFTNLSSKLLNQHNVDRASPSVLNNGSSKKVKRSEVARRIAASVNNAHQKPQIESGDSAGGAQTVAGEAPSSYGVKIVYSQQLGEDDTSTTTQQVVQSGVSAEVVDESFSHLSSAPTSEASVRTAITEVERMLYGKHQFASESPGSAQNNDSEGNTGFSGRVMCNRRFDNSSFKPNSDGKEEEDEVQSASGVSSFASVRSTGHEEEKLPIALRYSRYEEEECREMHPAISTDVTSNGANKLQESMQPTSSNAPLDESIVEVAPCDPQTVSIKEDVNDSTEQAWDRVELPWEEVSVTLSTTDSELPNKEPRTNRLGLSSWMSRRAKQAMGRKKTTCQTTRNGINAQESNGATTDHQEDEAGVRLKRKIYRKLKPPAKERTSKGNSSPSPSVGSAHVPVQVSVINKAPTIVVNKKMERSINKYPQLKVGGQHLRTGPPLDESKTGGSHSGRDPYGLQVDSENPQLEEDWYEKYLDDGSTGSSQILKQHSIDCSPQSPALTIPDSPVSTQSSKLVFLTEVVESETSAIDPSISWESFSNSPFNNETPNPTSQSRASEFSKNLFSDSSTTAAQTSEGIRTAKPPKSAKAAATVRHKDKTSTKKKGNTHTAIKDVKTTKAPRPYENGEAAAVDVKAREFSKQAPTRSAQGKESFRDPTPQRSNVSDKDQWEFFNPDGEIKKAASEHALSFVGSRARAALADHKLHKGRASMKSSMKRSPSSVAMATSTGHFDDSEFGRPFDVTTSAFDAETSFPPF